MKKKNILGIIIATILIAIVVAFIVYRLNSKGLELKPGEITNIEVSKIEPPEFTLIVKGLYSGTITGADLKNKNVEVYEFDAGMKTSFGETTNHYVGVKLLDVLKAMDITDYKKIDFGAYGTSYVSHKRNQINEKTYLIFSKDGEEIRRDHISLLAVDQEYRYSKEDITKLYFSDAEEYTYDDVESYNFPENDKNTDDD